MKTLLLQLKKEIKIKGRGDFGWYFWTAIILVHIIFFIVFYYNKNIYMADSIEYLLQSYNIKSNLSFYCADLTKEINPALYTKRPPLYGLIILILKTIYNSNYFILFIQNVFSVLNIVGLIRVLKEFKFSFDVRKILFVFIVFFPTQYIYNNMIMSEILLQTIIFWAFYNILFYAKHKKNVNILFYSILLALAVLTKPVLVYFWIPNMLFMYFLYLKNRKISILMYGLVQPAVILLFSFYGYSTTGSFNYSSQKPVSLLDYSATFILVSIHGEEEGWKRSADIHSYLDTISNYALMSKETERIAMEIIMDNKLEYTKLHLKGVLNYFFDPGRYDLNYLLSIKEKNHTGLMFAFAKGGYGEVLYFISRQPDYVITYLVFMLIINSCLVLSLILFLFNKKDCPEIRIFILLMVFYLSFMSGALGTMRYKTHIYFLLLFTIPFAFEFVKTRITLLKRKKHIEYK